MLLYQQLYFFDQSQTSQTVGQPYSATFPYGEWSLPILPISIQEDVLQYFLM